MSTSHELENLKEQMAALAARVSALEAENSRLYEIIDEIVEIVNPNPEPVIEPEITITVPLETASKPEPVKPAKPGTRKAKRKRKSLTASEKAAALITRTVQKGCDAETAKTGRLYGSSFTKTWELVAINFNIEVDGEKGKALKAKVLEALRAETPMALAGC